MFSYCVRARAYTHVLARVYSTRASTCTIYTCFTLPPTRVNPTGLQLSIFQQFWSFVTNIRTSMLPNKFYGRAQPNWDNFDFDFDNCGSYFWKILAVFDLFTIHIFANGSRYAALSWLRAWIVQKTKSLTLLKHTYFKPYVCKDFVGFPQKTSQWKFSVTESLSKKMHFLVNVLSSEIIHWARVRLILMSSTFHIAHLYRYTQNIPGLPQKLIWC